MRLTKGAAPAHPRAYKYGLPDFGNIDDPSLEPMMSSANRTGRPRKATGWRFD
ncbi:MULTISPECIES: hypothetical protein [unclassified Mesorhizobium]|uniref:hypothetical protein n=1 Tax=unclassified Mesorhizobium TaxID=325217 RepID=UPI0025F5B7A9|nr:hypothetical protein [Mesorhizobium sp.]